MSSCALLEAKRIFTFPRFMPSPCAGAATGHVWPLLVQLCLSAKVGCLSVETRTGGSLCELCQYWLDKQITAVSLWVTTLAGRNEVTLRYVMDALQLEKRICIANSSKMVE